MNESYETLKRKLAQNMVLSQRSLSCQKFGEFILQANKIQFYLSSLILLRSTFPDKEYIKKIESMNLGQIINLFCACAKKDNGESALIPKLRKHNKIRNNFAHKVLITSLPTNDEFKEALNLSNEIMTAFIYITNNEAIRSRTLKTK